MHRLGSLRIYAVLIILFAGDQCASGQIWKHDQRSWYSYYESSYRPMGLDRALVYDTCHREVWTILGSRIWKSIDDGVSWQYISIPHNQDIRSLSRLLIDGCNVVYAWDDKVANFAFRMLALSRETAEWRELEPLGATQMRPNYQWTALNDSSVFIVDDFSRHLYASLDLGQTWDTLDVRTSSKNGAADLITEVLPETIAIKRDTGFTEIVWKSISLIEPNLPYNTISYKYFDSMNIIAGVKNQLLERIGLSHDKGNSWEYLDSITFLNSPKVLRGKEGSLYTVVIRLRGGTATVYTKKGDIVSSSDRGLTWYDRGNIGELQNDNAAQMTEDQFGNVIVCIDRKVYLIPDGRDSVRMISRSGPKFNSMVRIDSSHYVGIGPSGLYISSDSGRVWWQPTPPQDLFESSTNHIVGVHPLYIDRFSLNSDASISFAAPEHQAIYRRASLAENSEYRRFTFGYPQFYEFDLVKPSSIDKGQSLMALRGDTTIHKWLDVSMDYIDSAIRRPIGLGTFVASSMSVDDDTDWLAVSDSIYISSNRGISWTSRAGAGLPRDADGRIYETSQILRLSPTTLLLGLRGIRIMGDSTVVEFRPGGLYRSDDNGATWQPSDEGLGAQTYVWFMAQLDVSTVLCAVGEVLADTLSAEGNNVAYNQAGATVMRSTDQGRTWNMVYDEPRGRPAFWGRREILATSPSRVLYASMEDGVVESTDGGLTWHVLGEMPLYDRFINDIDVDSMGTIYAGTDKGLFTFTPNTTSVEGDDHLKLATVWAYPTPVGDQLTVRVNNVNLISGRPKLTIVSIYGQQLRDLSALVTQAAGRQEFTISTSDLPVGVYLLVLAHSRATMTSKIMVRR